MQREIASALISLTVTAAAVLPYYFLYLKSLKLSHPTNRHILPISAGIEGKDFAGQRRLIVRSSFCIFVAVYLISYHLLKAFG